MKNWEREYERWRDEPHVGGEKPEKPAKPNPKCTHNRRHTCEECSYYFPIEPGERPVCNNDNDEWEEEEMEDKRECHECEKMFDRNEMTFTRDCQGITFRLVCFKCYDKVMAKGYDGQYYDERDECLDDDY